jgi:hypothetical protein
MNKFKIGQTVYYHFLPEFPGKVIDVHKINNDIFGIIVQWEGNEIIYHNYFDIKKNKICIKNELKRGHPYTNIFV